jgi:hypothetical protein
VTTNPRSEVLHALADLLAEHPEIDVPDVDTYRADIQGIRFQLTSHGDEAASMASLIVKAFPGKFTKQYVDEYFRFWGSFHGVPVRINTMRDDVCEARQVGTTTKSVQDPDALKSVPMVDVEVPVYEYDCKPILAGVA